MKPCERKTEIMKKTRCPIKRFHDEHDNEIFLKLNGLNPIVQLRIFIPTCTQKIGHVKS